MVNNYLPQLQMQTGVVLKFQPPYHPQLVNIASISLRSDSDYFWSYSNNNLWCYYWLKNRKTSLSIVNIFIKIIYSFFCRTSCYLHLLFFWLKFVPYFCFSIMIFLFLNIPSSMVTVIRSPTIVEWCLRVRVVVFNATFNNIWATDVYRGCQFYW